MPRKRWHPPPAAPARPRLDCTCEEYVRQCKENREKPASSTLAQWEESHGQDPEASKAEQERVAREERKIRKEAEKAAKTAAKSAKKKDKKKKEKKSGKKKAKDSASTSCSDDASSAASVVTLGSSSSDCVCETIL
mmetsp:Transcript_29874/g.69459  ORF Transcript_29874/g.69459 Transcript_29874/m.69459 type:complete len:136 (+) Transcript_29874:1-408(+)